MLTQQLHISHHATDTLFTGEGSAGESIRKIVRTECLLGAKSAAYKQEVGESKQISRISNAVYAFIEHINKPLSPTESPGCTYDDKLLSVGRCCHKKCCSSTV